MAKLTLLRQIRLIVRQRRKKKRKGAAEAMLWYVIQTYTGKEEKLVEMIRRIVPKELYGECFVTYHEQMRHRQQENQIHIERVFPGYVFITSDEPDRLFLCLKNVPAMSKLISDGTYIFLPLAPEEAAVLEEILDKQHVIRLSYVETDGRDHVAYVSGPLRSCLSRIENYQFRKRFAAVRLTLAGEEKHIRLGIILRDDVCRELAYGKVEAPIRVPERYRIPEIEPDSSDDMPGAGDWKNLQRPENQENLRESGDRRNLPGVRDRKNMQGAGNGSPEDTAELGAGDRVTVVSGVFAGMPAMVYQIRKHEVKIGVHFFGRDTTTEVPLECVRKTVA